MAVARRGGHPLRRLVMALCVAALMLPWSAGAASAQDAPAQQARADDPAADLDGVNSKLGEAREGLDTIERQRNVTMEDLHRIEAEQAQLRNELDRLRGELGQAEEVLAEAEADLAETSARLVATRDELTQTQAQLEVNRARFAARARESYKRGGVGLSTMSLDVHDSTNFSRGLKYVQVVMESDRQHVNLVAGLERQVTRTSRELAAMELRQAAAERVAQSERDQVAGLVGDTQAVLGEVDAKAQEQSLVLSRLEQDKDSYTQLVATLEDESQRLEDELRRRAEEQARREAAAAAEAARVAAEEAARQDEARRRAAEEARRRQVASAPAGRSNAAPPAPAAAPAPAPRAEPQAPASTGRFQRPSNGRVTSNFGYRTHPIFGTRRLHAGTDFGAPMGAPIFAADDGVVVSAGARSGYGITTVVDHGGGVTTLYAHQSSVAVSAGQRVSRGQVIGAVGSTGYSTGPHLHFEVRRNGSPVDARGYL